MNARARPLFQLTVLIILIVSAVCFLGTRTSGFRQSGEQAAKVWFYNEKSKRLDAVPRETIPPNGDAVRAIVIVFGEESIRPSNLKVAYLEKFAPELKCTMERIQAARAAQRSVGESIPPRDSPFYQTNTLVRRLDDREWFPSNSDQGRQIMLEWRSWKGAQGEPPRVHPP